MTQRPLSFDEEPAAGNEYHVPVLFEACMQALAIRPDGVYVDCTFGGGGHSRGILERLGPEGRLIAFDQDPDAEKNLPADSRITFVPQNFLHLHRFLRLYGIEKVDGLLADLGVSSHQFDEGTRGFSYRFDAPLDMRMDTRQPNTAAHILNSYGEKALQDLLSRYGEVTNARTLAAAMVERRTVAPFATINDLLQLLQPLSKGNPQRYYAQVFQALRIEVNDELGALKALLAQLSAVVRPGGRIAIITFHSLEDRMVKVFLKQGSLDGSEDPLYGHRTKSPFRMVHKKPIEANEEEVKQNPRARSARLRVAEVVGDDG
ncbi:MAG TPA: 16S rRNA (cytosine(1402)-N(4))-methyltransferase RsmH [Phnomibacter sp.]|nr:16S rRNA (cytosine(1402)-N(4))-methyltransferase RsmH [Phnomibacter sp.]